MQEEGDIDERVVIQAKGLLDAGLSLPQGMLGQRPPRTGRVIPHLELERSIFASLERADDPVYIGFILERKSHLGGVRLHIDNGFIPFSSLSEKRPRHCIEQGRFAGAVGAGDTGQVEAGEIHFDRVAIRKEP